MFSSSQALGDPDGKRREVDATMMSHARESEDLPATCANARLSTRASEGRRVEAKRHYAVATRR